MERKNKRKSKNSALKANEESADLQSASNLSLSNNVNTLNGANNSAAAPNLSSQNANLNSKMIEKINELREKPSRE
jgi:hypothetical protein